MTVDVAARAGGEVIGRGFRVALPPDDIAVSIARSMVRRITTFVSDDAESSFLVALTEVIGNAVDEHRDAKIIEAVVMVVSYDEVDVVHVIDSGRGFVADTDHLSPPPVSEQSGRGLTLARAFVPDMSFDTSESGTTVSLPLSGLGIIR